MGYYIASGSGYNCAVVRTDGCVVFVGSRSECVNYMEQESYGYDRFEKNGIVLHLAI